MSTQNFSRCLNRLSYVVAIAAILFGLGCASHAPISPEVASHQGHSGSDGNDGNDGHVGHEMSSGGVEGLGAVDFGVSCSPEVTGDFDRAVAQLHHMHYVEARELFEEIAAKDETCGMAHWGVAMTLFQPLWPSRPSVEALEHGWQEIQKAKELGLETEREKALVNATEAFFRNPETADWWTRINRWKDAMADAYEARPSDIETSAFYALSQLAAAPVAEDRLAHNDRAGDVLHAIWKRETTHPGAVHYTIHANDVDARADKALEVVRSYGEIAPDVPHALHMPTHIFVRLGEWPEVIDWNQRSAESALRHPAGDTISHHYPHAIDYLVYAYLQRGEDGKARAAHDALFAKGGPFQPTFISAFHLASAPARMAVERRDWEAAAAIEPRTPKALSWDRFWWAEAASWFAKGLGALNTGDAGGSKAAEERLEALRNAARDAGENGFANYIEIDRLVLASWRALKAGDEKRAIQQARQAIELEGSTQKHPVTPGAIYPSGESLGDLLLAMDQADAALTAYEESLQRWPGRLNSLDGAIRAAKAAGDLGRAEHFSKELQRVLDGAAVDRKGLATPSSG